MNWSLAHGDIGSEGFSGGTCLGKAPAHAMDEPGFRFPLISWVFPLVIDFRWEVVCTKGKDKGKVVSTSEQTIVILGNGGEWVGYPAEDTVHEKD